MNDLYFACKNCKVFVDAGYRWAYWTLEQPGIVKRKEVIVAEVVLSAEEYWNPDLGEGSNWLYKGVLPSVREFLAIHREHEIIFGEYEDFISWDDESFLEWKQLGYLLTSLPRYFVEELKFKSWDEVCEYIEQREQKPWWWELGWQDTHEKVKRRFEALVRKSNAIEQTW